jgi:beta-galactosidase beta subunit
VQGPRSHPGLKENDVIVTDLEHPETHAVLTPALRQAVALLQHVCGRDLPDNRVDVDGCRLHALVRSYYSIDGHAPRLPAGAPTPAKKIVVKVAVGV